MILLLNQENCWQRTQMASNASTNGLTIWLLACAIISVQQDQKPSLLCINAQFSIDPWLSHEIAVKRITCYLKQTPNDGLVLKPDFSLSIQCFVDADFAGTWDKEDCMAMSLCMLGDLPYGYLDSNESHFEYNGSRIYSALTGYAWFDPIHEFGWRCIASSQHRL